MREPAAIQERCWRAHFLQMLRGDDESGVMMPIPLRSVSRTMFRIEHNHTIASELEG
jgi:hypothetical protein